MKHLKGFKKLSRTHSHRRALYKNMVTALLKRERIKTTKIKAKEIRRVAEKIITKAKEKSLHNIRIIGKLITDKDVLMKLFNEIAPRYKERKGGYTRIIKLARRKGDGADTAYLELIEEGQAVAKKKKKSAAAKPAEAKAAPEAAKEAGDAPVKDAEAKQEAKVEAPKPAAEEKKEEPKKEETK
jgi:large subunit ribosomal protein L17